MADRFSAYWISHTSISDFLCCPRAYYLKNVYRDPKNNHKIKLMSPPLALGQCVHEVLESLSTLPRNRRLDVSLVKKFDSSWEKVSGKRGGFFNEEMEYRYKTRGQNMMRRVLQNPGPIAELSVKINMDLPYYWLSEEDNLILCGKIDWLEYFPETDSVHIIDFKTGKSEEDPASLQLPIYHLLVHNCQKRKASKASYWYLDYSDEPTEKILPNLDECHEKVLAVGRDVKLARQIERYKCPAGENGCSACRPFEMIFNREAEFVATDQYSGDVYVLPNADADEDRDGTIL
ncbi:MAG: PD-(D/E)XK nuclease family protein [Candidatus Magasanikbacteria bacterium]|nr:PD-(D/E)XK nuclease family protein [Candidatus Magasanikbacteria bacterium]